MIRDKEKKTLMEMYDHFGSYHASLEVTTQIFFYNANKKILFIIIIIITTTIKCIKIMYCTDYPLLIISHNSTKGS